MISLPYGSTPYQLDLPVGARPRVLDLPGLPPPDALLDLLSAALAAPIDAAPLAGRAARRVTVIVSDATRDEPRAALVAAVLAELGDAEVTLAIATGTHGPSGFTAAGAVGPAAVRIARVVDHDGHADRDLVVLGVTPRGTPVRVHRCLLDADLVVATGCIRPHYFAGWGAGTKAVFPGLGAATDVRKNHQLKAAPGARAGVIDGNPCREDLEDAAALLPTPVFLVNGVCGPDNEIRSVVAGDPRAAFRAGAALARPWFVLRATPAPIVVASDRLPMTASLYQASKLAAAVAPLVAPGGRLILAAECAEGIGPVDIVNRGIYEIGIRPRLAEGVAVVLVSALAPATVATSYARYAARVEDVATAGDVLVVPRATYVIAEAA